jgi:hypothetical protein
LPDPLDTLLDRLARAAALLDGHGLEGIVLGDVVKLFHPPDLKDLAAEADQKHSGEIGIGRISPLGPLEYLEALAATGHSAAGAVDERHDAIDIREIGENSRAIESFSHEAGNRGRAVHTGEDADIVPRTRLAVRAPIALERSLCLGGKDLGGPGVARMGIVAFELSHLDILFMNPLAWRNRRLGEAYDLTELGDRRPSGNGHDRHLVTARDTRRRNNPCCSSTLLDRIDGDNDIVGRVQFDRPRFLAHVLVHVHVETP